MTIPSIQPVSNFSGVAAISTLPVRSRASSAGQAPLVATPGIVVTIGANDPVPLLYNSAGLLQSLIQLDATNAFPAGPAPGSAAAQLQNDLGTVLGINTDTASAGILDATGSLADLSAGTTQALSNVLASGLNGAGGIDQNQALSDILSQALNFSSSGLDNTTAAANVLNAAGAFQGASAGASVAMLDSLLTANLGLAATALNSNISTAALFATPSLLQNSQNNSTSSVFSSVLATNVELATASLNAGIAAQGNASSSTSSEQLGNVLLSELNLSSAAAGIATSGTNSSGQANAATSGHNLPAEAAPQVLANLPTITNVDATTAANNSGTTAVSNAINNTPASSSISQENSSPTATSSTAPAVNTTVPAPIDSATVQLQNLLNDPASKAIFSVTRDPSYAAAAAALYLSAAVFRFQMSAENDLTKGGVAPARTVPNIQSIQAVKAV